MTTLHLPIMAATSGPVAVTMPLTARDIKWREAFIALWLSWPNQQRKKGDTPQAPDYAPQRNAKLMAAAQAHASELHYRQDKLGGIFGSMHLGLDGSTANERVRRADYVLPDDYAEKLNQVESISVDWEGPALALVELVSSPIHIEHVLGLSDYFRQQTQYGVGCSGDYFVLLTAHPEQGG